MGSNDTEFIRVVKDRNFTILNNEFLRRDDLSWKAKGILSYILGLPDDWKINMNEVVKHATDGKDSFRSGWNELKEAGYIERYPIRDKNTQKITKWETKVFESVVLKGSEPQSGFPLMEKPLMEKPEVENPQLLSTYITKDLNKQSTKKILSSSGEHDDIPYKEIVEYLNDQAGKQYKSTTKKTQSLIKARVNEGFELNDFKQVVDIKTAEWLNDSKMSKFLRPETLFGTKFESYLNQPVKSNGGVTDGRYDNLF